ncbi:hypothetical protein BDQ17DRAFT_1425720 [Cyathus striatus]|nr:hypothetical protein BDQ17DRAFT_1425720 [Cyathus striatus]
MPNSVQPVGTDKDNEEDMPSLVELSDNEDEPIPARKKQTFTTGKCKTDADIPSYHCDNDGAARSAVLTMEEVEHLYQIQMSENIEGIATTSTTGAHLEPCNLYDLGASHHMSPFHEDFVTFTNIAPHSLTTANQQVFLAKGIGDVIISVPNGKDMVKI